MEIISKEEARKLGFKKYFTGIPCKHGHMSYRYVNKTTCVDCSRSKRENYYQNNKERILEKNKEWAKNNPDKVKATKQKYVKNNPEKRKESVKKWEASNRGICNERLKRYRSRLTEATPPWLTETHHAEIKTFYKIVNWYKLFSHEKYSIDHIIPLQGNGVCGLHVPWNLQVLSDKDNKRKGNKYEQ